MHSDDQWPKYHGYQPLDRSQRRIRLVRLGRSSVDDQVTCNISHHSLDEKPDFDALSYYWGAPSETRAVLVNGTEVHVRTTLHRFLECLTAYLPIRSRLVWIDALCINQEDVEERSWQVSLMGDIFSLAENTYAWLGDGDPDCVYALHQTSRLRNIPETERSDHARGFQQYLDCLFMRPYWGRLWIVQETLLAKKFWIIYGKQIVSWYDIVLAFSWRKDETQTSLFLEELSLNVSEGERRFSRVYETMSQIQRRQLNLIDLMIKFRDMQCMDTRDKFYGLRGIAKSGSRLQVDYSKSKTDILFDVLSIYPPVYRPGRQSVNLDGDTFDKSLDLCSSVALSLPQLSDFLNNHANFSLLLWLRHKGTVNNVRDLDREYWVGGWTSACKFTMGASFDGSTSLSSLNSTTGHSYHVYELRRYRDSIDAVDCNFFAFSDTEGYSQPVGRLLYSDRGLLPPARYDNNVLIGNMQICRAANPSKSASPYVDVSEALLVHVSAAAYLALMSVRSGSLDVNYISEFTNRNKDNGCGSCLCNCSPAARIELEGKGRHSRYFWIDS